MVRGPLVEIVSVLESPDCSGDSSPSFSRITCLDWSSAACDQNKSLTCVVIFSSLPGLRSRCRDVHVWYLLNGMT